MLNEGVSPSENRHNLILCFDTYLTPKIVVDSVKTALCPCARYLWQSEDKDCRIFMLWGKYSV